MIYKTKRWQELRLKILKRDKYMCQHSKRYGKRVDATIVHHIFPVDLYPQYAYKPWNLISLSNAAHEKMHDKTNHKITNTGKIFQQKLIAKGYLKSKHNPP